MNNITPKNILLIRTDRIGDVVLTTPAIHALRQKFPNVRITILVAALTLDLVEGNVDVDEIMIDDRVERHAGWTGFLKLIREIRSRDFDTVVNFHTKKRTNLLCYFARIPRRIGYKNNKFGFLLTDQVRDIRPKGEKHEAQYCIDVLKPLGVEGGDLKISIPVQEEAERWADEFFKRICSANSDFKFIALHLGASCPTKRWPVRYFADIVKMIDDRKQACFVIIGASNHSDIVVDLLKIVGQDRCIYDLVGRISLARTASLLKRCDLLISNDSGPVHIAAAFNTPVVSIFTRNQPGINPERWCPLGEYSRYISPPLDLELDFSKGEVEDCGFLYRVTPQQVLDVVDAVTQLC